MMDFKLGSVISTLWKTKEFMLFRFLIYFAITLAYVIGTGTGDSGAAIETVQTEFPFALPVSGGKGRYGRVNVTSP